MRLHLDFETASNVDLTQVGLMNYLHDPSTRLLLAAWAIDDGPIKQASFEDGFDELRGDLNGFDPLEYPDGSFGLSPIEIHAWNAPFEWAVTRYLLRWKEIDLEQFHCTMAHSLYRAFPAKLDAAAAAMFGEGKVKDAKRLLRVWSMGQAKPKPGDWEKFCEYNRDDVDLERRVHHFLIENKLRWPAHERQVWLMGERINLRGVPVCLQSAAAAEQLHKRITDKALAEIKRITGIENPNSADQLREWLMCGSLDKKHMPELLAQHEGDERRVLELRQQIALSAPKKYTVALRRAHRGRVFNMLQYSGAGRTHRWSGRDLQPQNFRRGMKSDSDIATAWLTILHNDRAEDQFEDPFTLLADLVRSMIRSETGEMVVADYASIEVVMLHWAAKDEEMLRRLRDGLDPYKVFASWYWQCHLQQVTKEQRTFSKPVVLGAGYGLGAATLVEYAKNMGVMMTEEEAARAIFIYREANKPIVRLWYRIEEMMRLAIENPGKTYRFSHFSARKIGRATMLRLPSGRAITYWDADIEKDRIVYWGVNQFSKQWSKITTWGGKLVENVIQSISRDVLVHGLERAEQQKLDVVLHVHDEIVVESESVNAETDLADLLDCMTAPPWCADAPIHAAGFRCPRYRKD